MLKKKAMNFDIELQKQEKKEDRERNQAMKTYISGLKRSSSVSSTKSNKSGLYSQEDLIKGNYFKTLK
jgi:hypothetical protein